MLTGLIFICLAAVAVDGDTLRCSNIDGANGRVRLAAIDAPEMRDPGGAEAQEALAAMIKRRKVRCEQVDALPRTPGFQDRDPYGRIVARCAAGGADLGASLLASGAARQWRQR